MHDFNRICSVQSYYRSPLIKINLIRTEVCVICRIYQIYHSLSLLSWMKETNPAKALPLVSHLCAWSLTFQIYGAFSCVPPVFSWVHWHPFSCPPKHDFKQNMLNILFEANGGFKKDKLDNKYNVLKILRKMFQLKQRMIPRVIGTHLNKIVLRYGNPSSNLTLLFR